MVQPVKESIKVGACVQPDGGGVPSLVFTRYAIDRSDITGAGVGGGKAKRARAVGVGADAATSAAAKHAAWLAALDIGEESRAEVAAIRAEIAAGVVSEQALDRSILALCGGQAWAFGRGVPSLNSGGMGPRAARYVWRKRGVEPSRESIAEAATAAAASVWEAWTHLQAFLGSPDFSAHVGILAMVGWRAAFRSLTAGGRAVNGRHACGVVSVPLADAGASVDRASVAAWARVGNEGEREGRADASRRYARRCAVDWIASVLGAGRGSRAGQAARAQVTLLAWVICGASYARAARAARFASVAAGLESMRAGKVWQRLEAAATSRQTDAERRLVRSLRWAGLRAARAVSRQRAVASGATARGVAGYAAVTTSRGLGRLSRQQAARRVVIASPLADAWRAATDERAGAVARAVALRQAVNAERTAKRARWQRAARGLRSGHLRG